MSRDSTYDYDDQYLSDCDSVYEPEVVVRRAPTPGVAAVLSVVIPGLGQVYGGRLLAGALWFLATTCAYSAVLLPGFLVHAFCIWSAYQTCPSR